MLTIADEGLFITRIFLPRTASAHVFVRQRVWTACSKDFLQDEDTPALVKQVVAVSNKSRPFPVRGEPIVLKAAELVEHYPVVKKHTVLFCFSFSSVSV